MSRPAAQSLLYGILALAPAPAWAGAWIAPEGGQSIHSEVLGERDEGVFLESQLFYEHPLNAGASLVARPWLETAETASGIAYRGEAELSFKHVLARSAHAVTALQAGAIWVSDPEPGCAYWAGEARALGGVSSGGGRGFLNAEFAARLAEGACTRGRLDLAAGFTPRSGWLGLAEAFADAPLRGDAIVKAQLSLVRFGAGGAGVQLGVRGRIDGADAEPALVLGFWRRPGRGD